MTGRPTSYKLEAKFDGVNWTDVTADLVLPVGIHVGRSDEWSDFQPGGMTAGLYNDTGTHTPNSPTATQPITKGLPLLWSVYVGATQYFRFRGKVGETAVESLDSGRTAVTFSVTDQLGFAQQRILRTDWEERWAWIGASQNVDCFPISDDSPAATDFENVGTGVGTMTIAPAAGSIGSWEIQGMDQGLMLPGQLSFTGAAGAGPIAALDLGRTQGTGILTFCFKTGYQLSTSTSTADHVIAQGLDAAGAPLWSLRLVWNGTTSATDISLVDERTAAYTQWMASVGGDEQWKAISANYDGATITWKVNNANTITPASSGTHVDLTRYVIFGGFVPSWKALGKQSACPDGVSFAGIASSTTDPAQGDLMDVARPLVLTGADARLIDFGATYIGGTIYPTGSLIPQVTRTMSRGKSAFDCLAQVVVTICGTMYVDFQADAIYALYPDTAKPITSSATIDLGADDDNSVTLQWRAPSGARPTRVTVSSAFGSKTVRSAYLEDVLHLRQEESFESVAGSAMAAGALAGARLNRSIKARIPQLAVDLVHAQTITYATVLALQPGKRITVTSIPSGTLGITQADFYVMGWTETWGQDSAQFIYDLQPADAPAEALLDDATYGRLSWDDNISGTSLATVTGGTAYSGTGNGTLIITTASGPTLTTAAGSYPMDLDWNGERVTITSAPAGSSSPQTVTTTTRGKSPTVARVHATGEPINVWLTPSVAGI